MVWSSSVSGMTGAGPEPEVHGVINSSTLVFGDYKGGSSDASDLMQRPSYQVKSVLEQRGAGKKTFLAIKDILRNPSRLPLVIQLGSRDIINRFCHIILSAKSMFPLSEERFYGGKQRFHKTFDTNGYSELRWSTR